MADLEYCKNPNEDRIHKQQMEEKNVILEESGYRDKLSKKS